MGDNFGSIEFRGSEARLPIPIAQPVASQSRLQAGHQQRSRNSLAADIGQRDPQVCLRDAYEIIIIAADHSCRTADSLQLDARQFGQRVREKLLLNFLSDGELVFEALTLA